jgi:hypothetical protein
MARRVFFSFRYSDVWRVNQIRNMDTIIGCAAAGFQDASIWEEAKRMGDAVVKRLIDKELEGTTVTVVCVTYGTSTRKFINYEIDRSLARRNGLVAVQIHHLQDRDGTIGSPGAIPPQIEANGFRAYKYTDRSDLAEWIEEAARLAGHPSVGSLGLSGSSIPGSPSGGVKNPFLGTSGTSPRGGLLGGGSNPFSRTSGTSSGRGLLGSVNPLSKGKSPSGS